MTTANNKEPLSAKHLIDVLNVVLSILISACKPSARSEKRFDLTHEETKEIAKDAFLFGMRLVLFEIQFEITKLSLNINYHDARVLLKPNTTLQLL